MYVHWCKKFFSNPWSVFDFIIVSLSLIEAIIVAVIKNRDQNGGLSLVRLFRIFRIVRVFNKVRPLQRVILGITSTLIPMSNIVVVFLVINSIYSVLATRLYMHSYPDKFGTFFKTSYTMFQCATGDAWATQIVETLLNDKENNSTAVLLFFASYIVAVGIILFNIIVAVLLEGFLG